MTSSGSRFEIHNDNLGRRNLVIMVGGILCLERYFPPRLSEFASDWNPLQKPFPKQCFPFRLVLRLLLGLSNLNNFITSSVEFHDRFRHVSRPLQRIFTTASAISRPLQRFSFSNKMFNILISRPLWLIFTTASETFMTAPANFHNRFTKFTTALNDFTHRCRV